VSETTGRSPVPHIILYVLNKVELLDELLDSWREAGLPGATILESMGVHTRRQRKHVPMRFPIEGLRSWGGEHTNYTLFTVVPGEEWVARCVAATEKVVGSLDEDGAGILSAWPLDMVKGLRPALKR